MKLLSMFVIVFSFLSSLSWESEGLSNAPSPRTDGSTSNFRRDVLWKVPLGGLLAYSYGRLAYNAFSVQGIKYPEKHENRVVRTIAEAFSQSTKYNLSDERKETLRVLEVGIGSDCRIARRGLYDEAIRELGRNGVRNFELTGIDLKSPSISVLKEAQENLETSASHVDGPLAVDLRFVLGTISKQTPFSSGYFDCIICCLTLCSVDDPVASVEEMKRLLRPSGGTLGYVEHVAVDPNEPYRFLDWQQRKLDRVQQAVADNCHLHRESSKIIAAVMLNNDESSYQEKEERFLVDSMWPVSMQSCGVVQRRE